MTAKQEAIKKIEQVLFLPEKEAAELLTPVQLERKRRLMLCVSKKFDEPMIPDKLLVDYLTTGCDGTCKPVTLSTAYRDVAAVTQMTGNIRLASKAWYRYMIVEGAKETYDIAKTNKDGKAMAMALDRIGKYTRADKDDDAFDFSKLIPPSFEPSDDVTLLNIEPVKDLEKRRKELRRLFRKEFKEDKEIEDVKEIKDVADR